MKSTAYYEKKWTDVGWAIKMQARKRAFGSCLQCIQINEQELGKLPKEELKDVAVISELWKVELRSEVLNRKRTAHGVSKKGSFQGSSWSLESVENMRNC